jgi:two-component system response regulator FixJ
MPGANPAKLRSGASKAYRRKTMQGAYSMNQQENDFASSRWVAVVSRSEPVRRSLQMLLESDDLAVETYASSSALIQDAEALHPGCMIFDRDALPTGLSLRELLSGAPRTKVILLLAQTDLSRGLRHLISEVFDVFEMPFSPSDLLHSVRAAVDSHGRAELVYGQTALDGLTEREREILQHLVQGRSAKLIGRTLGISPRTVEVHRARIMDKLSARNLVDLVRIAVQSADASSPRTPDLAIQN